MTNHMWDGFWILANKKRATRCRRTCARSSKRVERRRARRARRHRQDERTVADDLKGKGLQFIDTDPAAFRDTLKNAGFYAEWKGKFGDEAWATLEKSVGSLCRNAGVPLQGASAP